MSDGQKSISLLMTKQSIPNIGVFYWEELRETPRLRLLRTKINLLKI
jgi:hypothetical protein